MGTDIRAIIFDMDGVLIEAKEWHYEALNRALALFGMEISRYDHLVTYDGLPTKKKLQMLSAERGFPQQLHAFVNELKQQYTMEFVHSKCKPRFFHEFTLARLRAADFRLVCCSNSIRATMSLMLDKANLSKFLDFYLSNEDVSKPKPDPEIYTKAMSRLELKPEQCVVVEDNPHGIEAGRKAGAHVMEVSTVEDVNYWNICQFIASIDAEKSKRFS